MRVRLLSKIEEQEVCRCLNLTGLSLVGSSVTDDFYHIAVEPSNLIDSRIAQKIKKTLGTDKVLINAT